MNIGILLIATNKYVRFLQNFIDSAEKYLLVNENKTFFIFSDRHSDLKCKSNVVNVKIDHEPWPSPTLKRYDYFLQVKKELSKQDYLFYSDVDMRFVDKVDKEILGERVATIHPGFWNKSVFEFTFERRTDCMAYIPFGLGKKYYAGGFNGGTSKSFLNMAEEIANWRKSDEERKIIPIWHDESYLNKYMFIHEPTVILSPSYCYPETFADIDYPSGIPFPKKLIALDKNHIEMRAE